MKIGNLKIEGHAALAPMAGVADRALRELCVSYGASYVIGEMASSKGISMQDRKSASLLQLSEAERPAGVQLFGDDPQIMARAAEMAIMTTLLTVTAEVVAMAAITTILHPRILRRR